MDERTDHMRTRQEHDEAHRNRAHESQIAAEAVHWFEELRRGEAVEATQRRKFARWLQHSPRNVHYFLFSTALDKTLAAIDPERKLNVAAMLAEARAGAVPLTKDRTTAPLLKVGCMPRRFGHAKRYRWAAGIAAALVLAMLAGWPLFKSQRATDLATGIGEQRTFKLEDGSVLQLNTSSRVRVTFSRKRRDVDLQEGEALFKVAHEAARPFRVLVDDNVIQALGTQFNVYRRPDAVMISVLEGKVSVQAQNSAVLSAGDEARVEKRSVAKIGKPDVSTATSWRQRRLVFRVTPLNEVVREFNRYNRSPKIRLEGLENARRHYTGTFDADDPASLALLLSQDPTLSVERSPTSIVIRPQPPHPP